MSHHNHSFKTRLSGVLLTAILLISPVIASADTLSDMSAKLAEASASLNKIITSLSTTQQAQVAGASYQTDLEIFKLCLNQYTTTSPLCAKSDFNSDGIVTAADYTMLRSSLIYDMNADLTIDLRDSADNTDLNFLKSCFGQYTASSTPCAKTDFTGDGVVNFADLASFKSAIKYDLNADSKVDLRDSSTTCMAGQTWNGSACVVTSTTCAMGQVWNGSACVVETTPIICPIGQVSNGASCVILNTTCPTGQTWNGSSCVLTSTTCATGQVWNGSVCVATLTTTNPTTDALQAQINSLLQQLNLLQGQLANTTKPPSTLPPVIPGQGGGQVPPADIDPLVQSSCTELTQNMRLRSRDVDTNGEVTKVQGVLILGGYLSTEATGYFGYLTLKAVQTFQTATGISPTGFVGPLTREKIRAMTCGRG
ncbi:MAG: peptidoglycan-binding protein [bacterium]|nr:peptidoglycan-binding protein [bacterium]